MLFDNSLSPEPLETGYRTVWRKERNVMKKVPCVTMHKHMMQGIYAGGGALVNTVFCYGINQVMERLISGLKATLLATTSDDVVRGYELPSEFRKDQVADFAIQVPHVEMGSFMMENSKKKLIKTDNHIEFNNIVVTKAGMIPQSPIHGALVVQPLLSLSPIGDIISVWATSAQSITWGDTPDLAQFASYGMARMLQQKWLFTNEEMNDLYTCGLLPSSIKDMIEGFFPRSPRVFSLFWDKLDEDGKESVKLGEKTLSSSFRDIAVRESNRKKKKPKILTRHDLPGVNTAMRTISNARVVAGRLNPRFVQNMPVDKRIHTKNRFMDEIRGTTTQDLISYHDLMPASVSLHFSKHRCRDSMPSHMGESASTNSMRYRNLRVFKYCNVVLSTPLTESEKAQCQLPDKEFEQLLQKTIRSEQHIGRSFNSPSGLPLVSVADGRFFSNPVAFNFSYSLGHTERPEPAFAYRSREVVGFKPCIWGGLTLEKARQSQSVLAVGFAKVDDESHIFYATKQTGLCRVVTPWVNTSYMEVPTGLATPHSVACVFKYDLTTIHPAVFGVEATGFLSGVYGDGVAILNYGNYITSSQPTGFRILQQIYNRFHCILHIQNRELYMPYPWFVSATSINRGNLTTLQGNRSARKLKLVENLGNTGNVTINLDMVDPK
jgi:hypothetical protein